MGKRTVYTNITPLPRQLSRDAAILILHSHKEMIELNPLVVDHRRIKPPKDAPGDEFDECEWFELTDKITYLPAGMVKRKVNYNVCMHNLPRGLQAHVYAPMGLDIREKWTIGGTLAGEPPEHKELGLDVPRSGLYLREDCDIRGKGLMHSYARKNLEQAHRTLVDKLLDQAEQDRVYSRAVKTYNARTGSSFSLPLRDSVAPNDSISPVGTNPLAVRRQKVVPSVSPSVSKARSAQAPSVSNASSAVQADKSPSEPAGSPAKSRKHVHRAPPKKDFRTEGNTNVSPATTVSSSRGSPSVSQADMSASSDRKPVEPPPRSASRPGSRFDHTHPGPTSPLERSASFSHRSSLSHSDRATSFTRRRSHSLSMRRQSTTPSHGSEASDSTSPTTTGPHTPTYQSEICDRLPAVHPAFRDEFMMHGEAALEDPTQTTLPSYKALKASPPQSSGEDPSKHAEAEVTEVENSDVDESDDIEAVENRLVHRISDEPPQLPPLSIHRRHHASHHHRHSQSHSPRHGPHQSPHRSSNHSVHPIQHNNNHHGSHQSPHRDHHHSGNPKLGHNHHSQQQRTRPRPDIPQRISEVEHVSKAS